MIAGYTCECVHGYYGDQCQTNRDDCASNPCLHGTCHVSQSQRPYIDTIHSHLSQFSTRSIQKDPNIFILQDLVGNYRCDCSSGWTGFDCDANVDECALSLCIHGSCTVSFIQ